ncbi:hypothetical protein LOK49_LG05G02142 [Camellia lanceoleosa]|uniref:Uncharacterized protein n=1 Tax=Camellia lanceoleosa TaxID=1840588 RepID=A0ACC0HKD9_9ERIC|nr:hypothetical protein LOK49_LG05G02142 [Camellia lanceoleosa]
MGTSNSALGLEFLTLEDGVGCSDVVSHRCLIGKILAPKQLNIPAISSIVKGAWKTRAPFSIAPWNDNLFLFTFEDAEDRLWSPFWVQVHGLSPEKLTKANGELIGSRIGRLIRVEAHCEGLLLYRNFLRLRVELDISKPLPRGFFLQQTDSLHAVSSNHWISFKFEKLSNFCFDCGRIGHERKACKFVAREEVRQSGYGPNLRTGIARSTGLSVEYDKHRVAEMDIRLRPLLNRCREQSAGLFAPRAPTVARGLEEHVLGTSVESVEEWGREKDTTEVLKNSAFSDAQGRAVQNIDVHSPMGNDNPIPSGFGLQDLPLTEASNGLGEPKAPSGPHYFVTEPVELPLGPAHKTALIQTSSSPIGIEELSPSSSPTSPNLKTIVIDECMATVFNSFTLKRKA